MITRQLTKARIALLASVFGLVASPAAAQMLPTGQMLTPLAAPGATFEPLVAHTGPLPETQADGAAAVAVSPDGAEMLVLTSGFNRIVGEDGKVIPEQSGQYLFRYAIDANGSHLVQTLTVPNAYSGVAWTPDGKSILIGGGEDDVVHRFDRSPDGFRTAAKIRLGHKAGNGVEVKPQTAGVAVSPDGARALVANYYNDSVSLIDLTTNTVVAERDLRPGKIDPAKAGVPGGEFPFAVAWTDATHATVSSPRDRELVQLAITANTVDVTGRITTLGEPTALLHDGRAQRLYATEDNADRIAIVDTASGKLIAQPRLSVTMETGAGPLGKGLNPNGLALTPDGRLLVTLGGINALAVITPQGTIEGMVPTGWYPSAVATDKSGTRVFVVNRKSPPGPNPLGCKPKLASIKSQGTACGKDNQYIYQLEKAGLLSFPMPTAQVLSATTAQVAGNLGVNNKAARAAAARTMATLRARIKHVVFIVKENRTYDQVLGDLPIGNGDPSLAILGRRLSPNHHRLAEQFVTLDNFYDSGEQSSTGWTWTTAARVTDTLEKTAPVNYAKRGLAYEAEEADRNVPTAQTMAERRATNPATPNDPDLMPGKALLTAPDADDKDGDEEDAKGAGFLWTAAIKAGLSVRNYGFADASVYDDGKPGDVPLVREPFKSKNRVWTPTDRLLATRSDIYFRGFDQRMPDYWRLLEWQREFAGQAKSGKMAALTLLRLSHDHFGNFKTAIDGVDTVETEMADNDYAVGMVLETLAKSPFRDSTMVFVVEDDAQNGADHVDARRSIALVAGAYVKQKTLVSARYTTVSMIRTIGDLLGLKPISLNAALALPMTEAFDLNQRAWTYHATASDVLKATRLPIAADRFEQAPVAQACATRDADYWARAMAGQDFSSEDRLDTAAFNSALWRGLGTGPEPVARTGLDLSADRTRLLAKAPGCS
jgi:DNA-binding beta-propeller fold protein YncE